MSTPEHERSEAFAAGGPTRPPAQWARIRQLAAAIEAEQVDLCDGLQGVVRLGGVMVGTLQSKPIHYPSRPISFSLKQGLWGTVGPENGNVLLATELPPIACSMGMFGDWNVPNQRGKLGRTTIVDVAEVPPPHYGYDHDPTALNEVGLIAVAAYVDAFYGNHPDMYGQVDFLDGQWFRPNPDPEIAEWDSQLMATRPCETIASCRITPPAMIAAGMVIHEYDYGPHDVLRLSAPPNDI